MNRVRHIVFAFSLILLASGCASSSFLDRENAAVGAGFKVITPKKPYQLALLEKLPPDKREAQLEIGAAISRYIWYGIPLILLIFSVIFAAVLMGSFNFGLGTEVPFSIALAVVIYSSLPGILRSLLIVISLYAGASPEGFDAQNPIATNLGFLLSRAEHPVWYSLASSVDLFRIWSVVLMGLGFATVTKVKRKTAMSLVFGWYIVAVLLGAGIVAIFS